jgi:anti-sigma factor RsiW
MPLMSAYLDRELTTAQKTQVDQHLEECPACAQGFRELEKTSAMIAAALSVQPKIDYDAAWQQIAPRIHCRPSLVQALSSFFKRRILWMPAGALAAAMLFLVLLLPVFQKSRPSPVSIVESVSSRNGSVMLLQSEKTSQPIIWIIEAPAEKKHS